jgi:pimeloyl-ACP methyl ester carboxylesterase
MRIARKATGGPKSHFANVHGTRLHYLAAGTGDPVVLLHGYAETSHMWRPLIAELSATHMVIAPDLRAVGQSATPPSGYTKAEMAKDIHALTQELGFEKIRIVGQDIGLMVAYAYAAQYPNEVDRIVLMDAFLPGVGGLAQRLADARYVAFSFLWEDAAGAGPRPRTNLFRAFLE